MNITGILTDIGLLESKSIKGSGITHFFIMEVDAEDSTFNTEDLTENSSVKVLLCTNKNYNKANLTMSKDAYNIPITDLLKYMTKNVPQLEKDDVVEFGPGYTLSDLIGEYIQTELECCWCRKFEDLQKYMDGSHINEGDEEDETIYVGDRVRIIKSNSPRFGLAGFVQRITNGPQPVQVKFRNVDHPVFFTMDDVRKL